MRSSAIRRILVVGHKKLPSSDPAISYCAWKDVRHLPDLADFDLVLVNLLTLPDDPQAVDWISFLSKFDNDAFQKVILPGGSFVVVGDPRFEVPIVTELGSTFPFLSWTGFRFEFENDQGRNIHHSQNHYLTYETYLSRINKYVWAYSSSIHSSQTERKRFDNGDQRARLNSTSFSENRSQHAVALKLEIVFETFHSGDWGGGDWYYGGSAGSIWLLPEITETPEETTRLALRTFFEMSLGEDEPLWAADIQLPLEEEVRVSLKEVEERIAELEARRQVLESDLARARSPIRLLYDTGESLEEAVRDALASLGAKVTAPLKRGEEDGWVQISIKGVDCLFVLEVKGVAGDSLGEDGLKQLPHWVQKGVLEREIRPKGFLIGTAARNKPVNERPEPYSPSFRKKAELSGFSVLSGFQLFAALVYDARNQLNRERFWQLLWETNGVVDLASALTVDIRAKDMEVKAEDSQVPAM